MFCNAISIVCALAVPIKVCHWWKFCQNFSYFSGGILRLFSTTRSVGRKYAILTGLKNRFFQTFSAKSQDFSGFSTEKVGEFHKKQRRNNQKKSRVCENFATPRENYLRPFFKKALTFFEKV